MTDPTLQSDAIDVITAINAAVRNLRLYPPGSAMINSSLEKVQRVVDGLLARTDSVVFAESEKNLLISDQPVGEKELQKPPIRAFLELMLELGVRTLTLRRGLDRRQLKALLLLLRRKPEEIEADGGLGRLMEGLQLTHIHVDEKLYVAIDKGQKVAAATEAEDAPATPATAFNAEGRGQDRLSRVLYSGIQPFADLAQGGPSQDTQAVFGRLISELAGLSAGGGSDPLGPAAAAASDLGVDALALLLSQAFDTGVAGDFHRELLGRMDDAKFTQVAARLKAAASSGPVSGSDVRSGPAAAYRRLCQSPKGQRLLSVETDAPTAAPPDRAGRIAHFKSVVQQVLQGARTPFEDGDVIQALSGAALQLVAKGKAGTFDTLMDKIGQALIDPAPTIRSNATGALAHILQRLPDSGKAQGVQRLLPQITSLTEREDRSSPPIETLFSQLKAVVQAHIRNQRYPAANRILEALERTAASPTAAEPMRNLVRSLIHTIADEAILQTLIQAHQDSPEDAKPVITQTLRLLVPASTEYLLDKLRTSETMSQRSHLMRLLPEFGDALRPVLLPVIERGGPWYFLRNLISLLGKVGRAQDLPALEKWLSHSDLRIQREALGSIYNIGDERRGEILLAFLPVADDSVKLNVVALLGALVWAPAVAVLVDMLDSRATRSGKSGEELSEKICAALGRIADPAAIPALEKVLQPRGLFGRAPSERIQAAARQALAQIRTAPPTPASATTPVTAPARTAAEGAVETTEAEIDRLAAGGDSDTAIDRLLALIAVEAKAKRFAEAERLRDKLYDIDALALGPIIQAGELIEAEKSQAIDSDHLDIFAPLYARLTEAERNSLYHAMAPITLASADTLIRQGQENERLYFINQGEIKIVYRQENREMLIERLLPGNLVGAESFFKATVATVSAVALARVKASCLTRSGLDELHRSHAGLRSKLQDYAMGLDTTAEDLQRKGMDRRTQQRVKIAGKVKVQLQDRHRRPAGRPFLGALADYSSGGISFYIKSAKPETARMLLGRRLQLDFPLPAPSPLRAVSAVGTVIGVNYLLDTDYSMHVRFDQRMDPAITEALAADRPANGG